jgi:hypothetical protein
LLIESWHGGLCSGNEAARPDCQTINEDSGLSSHPNLTNKLLELINKITYHILWIANGIIRADISVAEKAKPVASRGRKATALLQMAGLPKT